ncbi:uncharacterized protein LOC124305607 [Neodiprion virginianus]|uniref:uncharacterized protein LOC124305607 n=1 Tax=Neodiprion virginianus TaxID=2961670 RepID=UPI001EE736D2|nr:uncharacterized protein LOC124305607 [Neodiprion virginianus]
MACFVPEPKLIPQWISPIFPFAPSPWATFITMIFVSIAFTGIVIRGESFVRFENSSKVNLSEIVLTVLGVMLLQGLVKEPDRPSWAALAMTLLVVSLLLATAYGSSLASAMTIPRRVNVYAHLVVNNGITAILQTSVGISVEVILQVFVT